MSTDATAMPEPPDRALVALFDPTGEAMPALFERDDSALAEPHEDSWYDSQGNEYTWAAVQEFAGRHGLRVVRLYREDDPAIIVRAATNPATSGRSHWVFFESCGCPFGVLDGTEAATVSEAWTEFFDDPTARSYARDRGVVAERMTHARYEADVYPKMLGDYSCPHATAGAGR